MMTQLRQRMLEELQRRNYASGTIRLYLQHVAAFAQHFRRSPDQLGAAGWFIAICWLAERGTFISGPNKPPVAVGLACSWWPNARCLAAALA